MALRSVKVNKCLDKRLTMLGFEIPEIIALLMMLSVLNFLFSGMGSQFLFVFLPTVLTAIILRIGKRGKPDNFLVHLLRFQLKPGTLWAFKEPSEIEPPPKRHSNNGN